MTGLADVEFALCWRDARANHRDRRFVTGVAPAGDHLAGIPLAPLLGTAPGATITLHQGLLPGPTHARQRVVTQRADWPARFAGMAIAPRLGRWYPRQLLAAIPAIPAGSSPLRVVASDGDDISVDLAPPLASVDVTIEGRVHARRQDTAPRRATCCRSSPTTAPACRPRCPTPPPTFSPATRSHAATKPPMPTSTPARAWSTTSTPRR